MSVLIPKYVSDMYKVLGKVSTGIVNECVQVSVARFDGLEGALNG